MSSAETEQWVYLDLYCGDNRVERLAMKEGDDFEAEVHCDDHRIEVVGFHEKKPAAPNGGIEE